MLIAYLTRTRWNGWILSTFLAALCWFVLFGLISRRIQNFTAEIIGLYSPDCPVVIIDHGQIEMQGTIPFATQNASGVMALFDTTGQITQIPESAAVGSFLITDHTLFFRSSAKDLQVSVREIDISRLTLSHATIRTFFETNQSKFLLLIAIAGFLIFWLGMALLLLLGSALLLGADYLLGGKKNGTVIFNLAALLLIPISLFWVFYKISDWEIEHLLRRMLVVYLLTIIVSAIATRNKLNESQL